MRGISLNKTQQNEADRSQFLSRHPSGLYTCIRDVKLSLCFQEMCAITRSSFKGCSNIRRTVMRVTAMVRTLWSSRKPHSQIVVIVRSSFPLLRLLPILLLHLLSSPLQPLSPLLTPLPPLPPHLLSSSSSLLKFFLSNLSHTYLVLS